MDYSALLFKKRISIKLKNTQQKLFIKINKTTDKVNTNQITSVIFWN